MKPQERSGQRNAAGKESSPLGPVGVFDSGIGGLTVVAALRHLLPNEDVFYLGDTARVPYGGKSRATIERYSVEISNLLLAEHAKIIVVACSTSSALALSCLRELLPVPVIGVVEAGAVAAVRASHDKRIGVIGTKATVSSGAYKQAIQEICTKAYVVSRACPLLVPLVEEGMFEDEITHLALKRYLEPLLRSNIDTLVLGCTHYPLLYRAIQQAVGPRIVVVNSGRNCALAVKKVLASSGMAQELHSGELRVALTDSPEGFLRVAEQTLGLKIKAIEMLKSAGVAANVNRSRQHRN